MFSKFFGNKKKPSHGAKRRKLGHESLETRRLLAGDAFRVPMAAHHFDAAEMGEELGDHVTAIMEAIQSRRQQHQVGRAIDALEDGIANEDLPGDLNAEDAQAIIDGLNGALEAGDP